MLSSHLCWIRKSRTHGDVPMPETPGLMRQKHDDAALTFRTFHVGEVGVSTRHQLSRGNIDHSTWISQSGFRGSLSLEGNCIECSNIRNCGCAGTLCCTIHFVWQIWTWLKLQPLEFPQQTAKFSMFAVCQHGFRRSLGSTQFHRSKRWGREFLADDQSFGCHTNASATKKQNRPASETC